MISVLVMSANSSVDDVIPDGKTDCPLINQLTGKQTDEDGAVAPLCTFRPQKLREYCYEAYNIQVQGLATRLKAVGIERAVVNVSGGLNSTQALIVAAGAMDWLGLSRKNVLAYMLPSFATSEHQCVVTHPGARCNRRRNRHPSGCTPIAKRSQPPLRSR